MSKFVFAYIYVYIYISMLAPVIRIRTFSEFDRGRWDAPNAVMLKLQGNGMCTKCKCREC